MSLDSNAGQTLQFDTALPAITQSDRATSAQDVTCVVCHQTIADRYYDVNGHSACDRCREQLANLAATPKGFGVFAKAALFGAGAAVLGAVLYYAVIAIAHLEVGIVAIAIGYVVGYAIKMATASRGGRRFQILAIVLTYWAVGLAYTPFVFAGDEQAQKPAATAAAAPAPVAPQPSTPAAADTPLSPRRLLLAIGVLLALPFALPVLSVFTTLPSGLITAAIVAFGMQQAWRMTAAPQVAISGPYRIAPPLASA